MNIVLVGRELEADAYSVCSNLGFSAITEILTALI